MRIKAALYSLAIVGILAVFNVLLINYLSNNPNYYQLDAYTWETEEFRQMNFGEQGLKDAKKFAEQHKLEFLDVVTTFMIKNNYDLSKEDFPTETIATYQWLHKDMIEKKEPEYRKLKAAYETLLSDLKYFPIPQNIEENNTWVDYNDSWGVERTYGGERTHEGCDIMGIAYPRGHYPINSVSSGTIEKIGWLEKGGWRIGVRTDHGAYLYYAHMYGYSPELTEGSRVEAGQLLGFMGDTGYSTIEGTTGNFDVHLHMGMYLKTDHNEEQGVNPYWIMRFLEDNTLKYSY